jgi:hypothetical protein
MAAYGERCGNCEFFEKDQARCRMYEVKVIHHYQCLSWKLSAYHKPGIY